MIVFVLELTNGKYFIGHTYKSKFNLSDFKSDKLVWIRKYKPISVIDILENCSFEYYFNVIKVYMEFYGIKNVYSYAETNIDYCNEFVVFDEPSDNYEDMNEDRKKYIANDIMKTCGNSCVLCGNILI